MLDAKRATMHKIPRAKQDNELPLSLEVEIIKHLDVTQFYTLVNWLICTYGCTSYMHQCDEHYAYSSVNTRLRVTRSKDGNMVCMKYRHYAVDIDGVRITYSSERVKPPMTQSSFAEYMRDNECMMYDKEREVVYDCVRDKVRYVFDSTHCEIHCTVVNGSSYSVEIEAKDCDALPAVVADNMTECLAIVQSPDDVTHDLRVSVQALLKSGDISDAIGHPFKLQKPVDVSLSLLKRTPMLQCAEGGYVIATRKVDGTRAMLFVSNGVVAEYSPQHTLIVGTAAVSDVDISLDRSTHHVTVLDCEKTMSAGVVTYHVFDCILRCGFKTYTQCYEDRHEHALHAIASVTPSVNVCIEVKPYHKYGSCTQLGKLVDMYDIPDNDGLILYDPHTSYHWQSTVCNVFKWKYCPTVDVLVDNKLVYVSDKKKLVQVEHTVKSLPAATMHGVVECKVSGGDLVFTRHRKDKTHPNSMPVYQRIVHEEGIDKSTFTGTGSIPVLMRMVHNQVKAAIIKKQRGRLLDVGSGHGPDVSKWNSNTNLRHIVCLEPNASRLTELKRRIGKHKDRHTIINGTLQGYTGAAGSFDCINMFFVLNDIHPSDHCAVLTKCKQLLKANGTLNLLLLDYDNIPSNASSSYYSISHKDNVATFTLHGAMFNDDGSDHHTEHAISGRTLRGAINSAGLTIASCSYIRDGFMTLPEAALSSYYMVIRAIKR